MDNGGQQVTTRAAMILAAGFGTRMGALTANRPKPLIEVAGQSLLSHAIAAAEGAAPLVVNGHYRAAQLRAHLRTVDPSARFSEETPDILDSGGGIKQALPWLGADPILTLNADAVWNGEAPARRLERHWDGHAMDALLLLVARDRAMGRQGGGDFALGPDGRLTWDKSDTGWVYTGAQILRTDAIAAHPECVFSLREIWETMMSRGRLYGCIYAGQWADVGHPAGIEEAEAMLTHDT